jgi:AraC-like DNA-binding protein
LIHTYKIFVGDQFRPIEMRFPHSFAGASTLHEEFLGCPVKFNHEFSQLTLPREALLAPIKSADHRLLQILTRYCEEVLSAHANRVSDLVTKFERLVLKLLPSGRATAQIVAAELGMSERTLARRLAQENTSFTETLDTLRQEMPLKYLHRRDLQLSEVAFLLGYAIHSSFCVAFKRWTGKSPSALRSA